MCHANVLKLDPSVSLLRPSPTRPCFSSPNYCASMQAPITRFKAVQHFVDRVVSDVPETIEDYTVTCFRPGTIEPPEYKPFNLLQKIMKRITRTEDQDDFAEVFLDRVKNGVNGKEQGMLRRSCLHPALLTVRRYILLRATPISPSTVVQ